MLEMEKPHVKVKKISEDGHYATFEVLPLERGFGNTLGNALRRVLLSSMPGVAITTVKIDGVTHEFSSIPGVKEDVVEIILNLKGVIARLYCDNEKNVFLSAKGPCSVTAGMIECDSEIEICNPDFHIVTLGKGASINMELTFNKGRGYCSAQQNRKMMNEVKIGTIPIDSIYSPVLRVNHTVENTRVGQATDFDKLTLDVYTNGVITAEEAVATAVNILKEHLNLFSSCSKSAETVMMTNGEKHKKFIKNVSLDMSLEELDLTARSYNCLKRARINTLKDLMSYTYDEIIQVRNLGQKSIDEVMDKMRMMGLSFKKSRPNSNISTENGKENNNNNEAENFKINNQPYI